MRLCLACDNWCGDDECCPRCERDAMVDWQARAEKAEAALREAEVIAFARRGPKCLDCGFFGSATPDNACPLCAQHAAEKENKRLRAALQGLFDASDSCLGESWRGETLGQGNEGDAVNQAWDECARQLGIDPMTLEEG